MYAVDAYTNPHEIKEMTVEGQPKKRVVYHPEQLDIKSFKDVGCYLLNYYSLLMGDPDPEKLTTNASNIAGLESFEFDLPDQ